MERALGIEFPESFKLKMMVENGGEFSTETDDWQLYPFLDRSDNKRISRACNHILLETNQARGSQNFPKEGGGDALRRPSKQIGR